MFHLANLSTRMYLTSLIAALSLITTSSGHLTGCGEDGSVKPDCRQRPIGIPAGVSFYMPHEFGKFGRAKKRKWN